MSTPPERLTVYPLPVEPEALLTSGAPDLPPNVSGSFLAVEPDGTPVMALTRFGSGLEALRSAARSYPAAQTYRSAGIRNLSRSFGFIARNQVLQRNACRVCSGAIEANASHTGLVTAAAPLADLEREMVPDRYDADMAMVSEAVLPEWRMAPTAPWTSGVVNFDSPLPYHYDRNNFDCWSAMVTIRRGAAGGHLHCPGWGLSPDGPSLVLPCADGDVVMFNGQRLLHGVTPLGLMQSATSYRISIVYYAVSRMRECLKFEDEVRAGRVSRSAREDHWKDNQEAL